MPSVIVSAVKIKKRPVNIVKNAELKSKRERPRKEKREKEPEKKEKRLRKKGKESSSRKSSRNYCKRVHQKLKLMRRTKMRPLLLIQSTIMRQIKHHISETLKKLLEEVPTVKREVVNLEKREKIGDMEVADSSMSLRERTRLLLHLLLLLLDNKRLKNKRQDRRKRNSMNKEKRQKRTNRLTLMNFSETLSMLRIKQKSHQLKLTLKKEPSKT